MDITGLGAVFDFGAKIIDKLFPDKTEAEKLKLAMLQQQQAGEFKDLEMRFSAIVAEANSQDPWTSRARPSFMYVMYALLLASLPMGGALCLSARHGPGCDRWRRPVAECAARGALVAVRRWLPWIFRGQNF